MVSYSVYLLLPEMSLKRFHNLFGSLIEFRRCFNSIAIHLQQALQRHYRIPTVAPLQENATRNLGCLGPMADAMAMQKAPIEFLARINLAPRGNVRVRKDVLRQDTMAFDDVLAKVDHGFHLFGGEVRIAGTMTRILYLNADGAGIDVSLTFPAGDSRMPGTHFFANHLHDGSCLIHKIVTGYLGLWHA